MRKLITIEIYFIVRLLKTSWCSVYDIGPSISRHDKLVQILAGAILYNCWLVMREIYHMLPESPVNTYFVIPSLVKDKV